MQESLIDWAVACHRTWVRMPGCFFVVLSLHVSSVLEFWRVKTFGLDFSSQRFCSAVRCFARCSDGFHSGYSEFFHLLLRCESISDRSKWRWQRVVGADSTVTAWLSGGMSSCVSKDGWLYLWVSLQATSLFSPPITEKKHGAPYFVIQSAHS
jgi:hypothetical protein